MFESLSDRLERAFKVLKGQGHITDINVAETMKEVRKALLDADVSYKIAKEFTDSVKAKALGMNVLKAVSPSQMMVKITYDELIALMGRVCRVRVRRRTLQSWPTCCAISATAARSSSPATFTVLPLSTS